MMDTLELLKQADNGIWHKPATELIALAICEIEWLRRIEEAARDVHEWRVMGAKRSILVSSGS